MAMCGVTVDLVHGTRRLCFSKCVTSKPFLNMLSVQCRDLRVRHARGHCAAGRTFRFQSEAFAKSLAHHSLEFISDVSLLFWIQRCPVLRHLLASQCYNNLVVRLQTRYTINPRDGSITTSQMGCNSRGFFPSAPVSCAPVLWNVLHVSLNFRSVSCASPSA